MRPALIFVLFLLASSAHAAERPYGFYKYSDASYAGTFYTDGNNCRNIAKGVHDATKFLTGSTTLTLTVCSTTAPCWVNQAGTPICNNVTLVEAPSAVEMGHPWETSTNILAGIIVMIFALGFMAGQQR